MLSRLHPQAFPANPDFQFLGSVSGRKLSYPLGYWNALADYSALGFPLLLDGALAGPNVPVARWPRPCCRWRGVRVPDDLAGGTIALAVGVVHSWS